MTENKKTAVKMRMPAKMNAKIARVSEPTVKKARAGKRTKGEKAKKVLWVDQLAEKAFEEIENIVNA